MGSLGAPPDDRQRRRSQLRSRQLGHRLAQVLGAVYAVERLEQASRLIVAPVLHKAAQWRGPIGPALIAHLAGAQTTTLSALADPTAWALDVLGFPVGTTTRRSERSRPSYRVRGCALVHPDHGGDRAHGRRRSSTSTSPPDPAAEGAHDAVLLFPGAGTDRDQPTLVAIERAVAPACRASAPTSRTAVGPRAPTAAGAAGGGADELDAGLAARRRTGRDRRASMGGRMCSMVAAGGDESPPPRRRRPRPDLLSAASARQARPAPRRAPPAITVPACSCQGTSDPFGTPDELERLDGDDPRRRRPRLDRGRAGHDLQGLPTPRSASSRCVDAELVCSDP